MDIGAEFTTESLIALGNEASSLLCAGDIDRLADRFGYALAYGREKSAAISEDLRRCLAELGATEFVPRAEHASVSVKYFASNDTGLRALVECLVPNVGSGGLLLELVVTGNGDNGYLTLEDISVAV